MCKPIMNVSSLLIWAPDIKIFCIKDHQWKIFLFYFPLSSCKFHCTSLILKFNTYTIASLHNLHVERHKRKTVATCWEAEVGYLTSKGISRSSCLGLMASMRVSTGPDLKRNIRLGNELLKWGSTTLEKKVDCKLVSRNKCVKEWNRHCTVSSNSPCFSSVRFHKAAWITLKLKQEDFLQATSIL